jgi:iron complex transport system ATP-binding protein
MEVDGIDVAHLSARARARRSAIVLTDRMEAGNLTVHALAALGRHPFTGWSGRLSEADCAAVRAGLEEAGAWDLRDRWYDELSDGEKQRAMLARALAQDPALLLLDEPTAFLDLPRRVETLRSLRALARGRGRAVLLSTHDLDLAMRAADRLWLLPSGGPVLSGAPEDLALRGAIGRVFDQGDVAFDPASGQFRVHGHPGREAGITGDPVLAMWTARALEREGYRIVDGDADASIRIAAGYADGVPEWKCSGTAPGLPQGIFASLEALAEALRG